jgi:hypothetical protein
MNLNKKYKINYSAEIKTNGEGLKIWIAEPQNDTYQKISNFLISLKSKKTYQDNYKNTIHYIDLPKNKKTKISIDFYIKNYFFTKEIDSKKVKIPSKKFSISKNYTKEEKYLEQTKELKKLAFALGKEYENPIEIAKNIYIYIINNFKYCHPIKKRGVKNLNLRNLKGDCGEYSALFATLCRINKIPTKINTGFAFFPEKKSIQEHAWNSIYLKPYGWLDVDTQYGSLEKNKKIALKKYFCKRIENRIISVVNYDIPIKPAIPKEYKIDYWKKQGLPIDRKSVQILQPLIFTNKHHLISFRDKIKLNL